MVTQSRVIKANEVAINNVRYKLAPGVQRVRQFSGATLPGKITLGDYNLDSHPLISTWLAVNDQRGGIGINRMDVSKDLDRCWTSLCELQYRGHLTLPSLVTDLLGEPATHTIGVVSMFEHGGTVYGIFLAGGGTATVRALSTITFGSNLKTLAATALDVAVGILNGSETVVIAQSNNPVDWSTSPGSSWTDEAVTSTAVIALAFHNDLLWGMASTGRLYFTHDLTLGWTLDNTPALKLPSGGTPRLLQGQRPDGERALYASTPTGLWIHDEANNRWFKTAVNFPEHPWGGRAAVEWRGSLYCSAGLAIHKLTPGTPSTTTVMGPDRDDGIPTAYNGTILGLVNTPNELIAITNGYLTDFALNSNPYVIIWGYNERGWRIIWSSGELTGLDAFVAPPIASTYGGYRLYWIYASNATAIGKHISLPQGIVNPSQSPSFPFESGAKTHETPWFDAGVVHQNKLAVEVRLETTNPTSSETVLVEYATNYVESYTSLGTISATGETTYHLPTSGNHVGVEFRSIKFRLTLTRGGTSTNTPDVIKCALLFMRTWDDLRGYSVTIELTEGWGGLTVLQQREALDTLFGTKTLVDFTFRDESDDTENHMVTVRGYSSLEQPGHSNIGQWQIQLVESH